MEEGPIPGKIFHHNFKFSDGVYLPHPCMVVNTEEMYHPRLQKIVEATIVVPITHTGSRPKDPNVIDVPVEYREQAGIDPVGDQWIKIKEYNVIVWREPDSKSIYGSLPKTFVDTIRNYVTSRRNADKAAR